MTLHYAATYTGTWTFSGTAEPQFSAGGPFTTYTFSATYHANAGAGAVKVFLHVYDSSGTELSTGNPGTTSLGDGATGTITVGPGAMYDGDFSTAHHFVCVVGWDGFGSPASGSVDLVVDWDATADYCQYGTENNPDAQVPSIITGAVIDAIILANGWSAVAAVAFDTMIGAPLEFPICGSPPPDPPAFGSGDFMLGTGLPSGPGVVKMLQMFRSALWHFYCRCIQPIGSPIAIPYPPPAAPPDWTTGTSPPLVCSNEDICSTLNAISRQLQALNQLVLYTRNDVQIVQRTHVPFAYVAGTAHSGLSGTGTLTVSRAIAFQVTVEVLPAATKVLRGDPVYLWDMGWMAINDADGMLAEKRITRQSMVWIPEDGQLATTFTYYTNPGVQIGVVPLYAEP